MLLISYLSRNFGPGVYTTPGNSEAIVTNRACKFSLPMPFIVHPFHPLSRSIRDAANALGKIGFCLTCQSSLIAPRGRCLWLNVLALFSPSQRAIPRQDNAPFAPKLQVIMEFEPSFLCGYFAAYKPMSVFVCFVDVRDIPKLLVSNGLRRAIASYGDFDFFLNQ